MDKNTKLTLAEKGFIGKIDSGGIRLVHDSDDIIITTDKGSYSLSSARETVKTSEYSFRYSFDKAEFTLDYEITKCGFVMRTLGMSFPQKTTLLKVSTKLPESGEKFLYKTFPNASAAVFLREGQTGCCFGAANPFFYLEDNFIVTEPAVILDAGEKIVFEPDFAGVYGLSGELISPELSKTQIRRGGRYHPRYRNPSEGIPLDFSEIMAMNSFISDYFCCDRQKFRFMSYNFFSGLPQRPSTEAEVAAYLRQIDAFAMIGGDTILFNPLCQPRIPDASGDSFWELMPESSAAERIVSYARSRGMKVGFYMGTACNYGGSNSFTQNYADIPEWKKVSIDEHISEENCIADDSFTDWYIKVQKNTIRKYNLNLWDWDPGSGNAFFCHNHAHKHLPGKGGYLGFRNAMRVMREIKEEFPDIYFMSFHGLKEYGVWGFRYVDQHEAYWENEVYIMNPVFDDLLPDRCTADGMRMQSVWDWYFRFLPASMNHGLAHRMLQACYMNFPDLDKLVDICGFRFALMSALAAGGSVTLPIIPASPEKIDGYTGFYHKWIGWARENFGYSPHTIPFGAQVGCGVEGYSKLKDNEGFIFVVNPFPQPLDYSIDFTERIGFSDDTDEKHISMLYPHEQYCGKIKHGSNHSGVIPGYEVILLRVSSEVHDNLTETTPAQDRYLTAKAKKDGLYTYEFFASDTMMSLLTDAEKYVDDETNAIEDDYIARTGRPCRCWTRPDRLWLWIFTDAEPEVPVILVNGKIAAPEIERNTHICSVYTGMYIDITDMILPGKLNEITLSGEIAALNPRVFLQYQKACNEEFPDATDETGIKHQRAPVVDDSVRILSASLGDDNIMRQNTENSLTVIVNLPEEMITGVYASVPISIGNTGNDLKCDMELFSENGVWKKTFLSGDRKSLIIDDNKISVWAVTKNNTESPAYDLYFNWDL